jgi:hypothetical protein
MALVCNTSHVYQSHSLASELLMLGNASQLDSKLHFHLKLGFDMIDELDKPEDGHSQREIRSDTFAGGERKVPGPTMKPGRFHIPSNPCHPELDFAVLGTEVNAAYSD